MEQINQQNDVPAELEQILPAQSKVHGYLIQKDWLKGQQLREYRARLHSAFEKAALNYKIRKGDQNTNTANAMLQKIKRLEQQDMVQSPEYKDSLHAYSQIDPPIPNLGMDRLKLIKLSRSCSKNMIERYFTLNQEQFVYYKNELDSKPKKAVSLEECRIRVESYEQYQSSLAQQVGEDQRLTQWTDQDKRFRLQIRLKSRKFQPAYYYSEDKHQATCIKTMIEQVLSPQTTQMIQEQLNLTESIYQIFNFRFLNHLMFTVRSMRNRKIKFYQSVYIISQNYLREQREQIQFIDREIKRMKEIEYQDYLKRQEKPVIEVYPEPEKIPELYSTFQRGQAQFRDYFYFKNYSKSQRHMKKLAQFIKERKSKRHPNKIGDIPYLISDVNGLSGVKVEEHEYHIPLNEICYICTDIGYQPESKASDKSWKLQLRGRKINANVSMISDNVMPQQIGLERQKYSRLTDKTCLKLSLKRIQIPLFIQDQLKSLLVNPKDKILFRMKFEIGEFYCYTTFFQGTQFSSIDLKEDMTLDIHDAKHMKLTLLAVKGRPQPNSQIVNEFVNEQIVSFVNLRMRDFENEGGEMLHTITFNKQFYNSKETNQSQVDSIVLNAAFVIIQLNGAYPSVEMEGPQLLLGRYAIYKKQISVKIIKVNRNLTATVQIVEGQPQYAKFPQKVLDNVNVKQELSLIERYGISIMNLLNQPQNYLNGQYEWSLDLLINQNERQLLSKLFEGIQQQQLKQIYQQRLVGFARKQKSQAFVCGRLYISIMNAQNLANQDKTLCDSFVQISIRDTNKQSNAKFIDIANEQSFIMCKKNSEDIVNKNFKTTLIKQNNNPQWVTTQNPQGETFDLGMYMKKYPHFILIEVYHQKKKSRFSSEMVSEMIGFAELATEDLLSLDNFGQEFYLFLEDSINKSALIKIRSLFIPSFGTIERLNLDTSKSLFKNAQQFLFFKVLHLHTLYDDYGYQVPLGRYLVDFNAEESLLQALTPGLKDPLNATIIQDAQTFSERYERFSPEHKKHRHLQDLNPMRPRLEENAFVFKQIWLYTQFVNRNKALNERQRVFWEEFMTELMKTADDEGFVDDELKSIRSKLTNTTKMISQKYRKRSGRLRGTSGDVLQGNGSVKDGQDGGSQKGSKFSVTFIGQWEKDQNWKYVDIWYLVKFGIPEDLRVSLWKDLLRRQINEQQIYVYFRKNTEYGQLYNVNISIYENLKVFAGMRDSAFYQQIENDIRDFQFPKGYLKNVASIKEDRQEEERLSFLNIFKAYSLWAMEFSKLYNSGLLHIVQRFMTIMNEEDAYWALIGMTKAFNNVFIFDYKPNLTDQEDQYEHYTPLISRRVAFKNEMTILSCLLRLHYPLVYNHLRSLSMPIDYYFYTSFTRFFSSGCFSSEIILRLWDMLVFNLSTNSLDNRKRALWYLLAVPLYMVQTNQDLILKSQNPKHIKRILKHRTGSINYNPNLFIDELLAIIRMVFVKKDTVVNKLLKNDKAHQLENMRIEIELEMQKRFKLSQDEAKKLAKYSNIERKGLEFIIKKLPQNYQVQQQMLQVKIQIVALRNMFEPQIDPIEQVDLQVNLAGSEEGDISGKPFRVQIPVSNEQAIYQKIQEPQPTLMTNMIYKENKKLTLNLLLLNQGQSLGKCTLAIDDFISSPFEQFLSLKCTSNKQERNAYVDLKIKLSLQNQKQDQIINLLQINGITAPPQPEGNNDEESGADFDLHLRDRDSEVQKTIQKELIQQVLQRLIGQVQQNDALKQMVSNIGVNQSYYQSQEQGYELLQQAIDQKIGGYLVSQALIGSQRVMTDLAIDSKTVNYTQLIVQLLIHSGQGETVYTILQKLFDLFKNQVFNKISQQNVQLLVWHLYNSVYYPIPFNEVKSIIETIVNHNYSGIVKVTQQQSLESFMQNRNIFNKLFTQTQQPSLTSYDVTDQFKGVLNSVIRVTGQIDHIDLSVEPFSNINFWLRQTNNLKKLDQILTITQCIPSGDLISYPFNIDSQGQILSNNSILPLHHNGYPYLTLDDFQNLIMKLPLLANLLKQDLFLRCDQLFPSQEIYVDSPHTFKITFQGLNKKRFVFNFSPDIDKQEDFTVDEQQLMRIAKGDISRVYQKEPDGSGYQVWLSALSRQDTFIMIKNRMRLALEFIGESENLRDSNALPNIMSEKFQFKRTIFIQGQAPDNLYFNSLDRLMNVTSQKELEFELVRVNSKVESDPRYLKEQYQSFALYSHPNGIKEWRPCKILMKMPQNNNQGKQVRYQDMANYRVEFWHEKDQLVKPSYVYPREDILLSFEYKRLQEHYYREEIQEFLDKLDQEEVEIAEILKEQDKKQGDGMDDIKKQLNYQGEDQGLKIGNKEIEEEEEKDEEMKEIRDLQLDLEVSQISE